MSIFSSILGKIFGTTPAEAAPAAPAAPASEAAAGAPSAAPAPGAPASVPADVAAKVDIAAVLDDLNEKNPETLNWRVSIVDLLKVLGLDSSLTARKALAAELKYEGDTHDSAKMNMWLHDKVIALVAANGGKVPADLLNK
jgi:3-oxoacyl-ACP reductase-like protein